MCRQNNQQKDFQRIPVHGYVNAVTTRHPSAEDCQSVNRAYQLNWGGLRPKALFG